MGPRHPTNRVQRLPRVTHQHLHLLTVQPPPQTSLRLYLQSGAATRHADDAVLGYPAVAAADGIAASDPA